MEVPNYAFEPVHSLFRRCISCPTEPPSCPSCPADETCSLKAPSCYTCATTICVKNGSLPGQIAPKSSKPIGAIVGGVIAGLLGAVVLVYLIYRFCIRPKRRAMAGWESPEKRDQHTLNRSARQSTRSAHSIASTALTRASNVIQIAYIPGVTVRSPPASPGLAPPPFSSMAGGTAHSSVVPSPAVEQHFFMPGDLRDSTWSDGSSVNPRISLAPSLARTTLYVENEVVPPIPAQQAYRAQANVVSVRSGSSTPTHLSTMPPARAPPGPQVQLLGNSSSSIVARNVTARPIEVKKPGSGPRVPTLANLARQSSKKGEASTTSERIVTVYSEEKEVLLSPTTIIDDSPNTPTQISSPPPATIADSARSSSVSAILPSNGPLGSGSAAATSRQTGSAGLNAIIEDALTRAQDTHLSVQPKRPQLETQDSGPFSDSNELKENHP